MLVKVRDDFHGTFGHYIERLHSVEPKRSGDAPFEVPDRVAREQIANGVLEAVDNSNAVKAEIAPVQEEEAKADKDLSEMSYAELKTEAKARGIRFVGKSREELAELIEKYDASEDGDAPEFEAEDPV